MNHDLAYVTRWCSAQRVAVLILMIFLARIVYLLTICPYELAGDEAHYWEWSRRLALSYYTKGPGVAWTIAGSTAIFGHTEFAIRFPAVLCSAITMFAIAILGTRCAKGDWRVGGLSALVYTLVPAYLGTSQFMTIDMPYFMCTVLSVLAAQLCMTLKPMHLRLLAHIALGLILGIGALYKYTILLLVPGFLALAIWERKRIRWAWSTFVGVLLTVIAFTVAMLPIIIWNVQEDWATVSHLLGHVHMSGGDTKAHDQDSYSIMWTLEAIGGQLATIGPPVLFLILIGATRKWSEHAPSPLDRTSHRLLLCCGLPVLVFYTGVSFLTDIEANWPLAAYLPLIPLGAAPLVYELPRYSEILRQWKANPQRPRPKQGFLRRKPETLWQVTWHWVLGWGIVAAVLIACVPYARLIPGLEDARAFNRISGHEAWAQDIAMLRSNLAKELGVQPTVLVAEYQAASLLAFYLPEAPVRVYNANQYLGGRRTPYDFFADTNLGDEQLQGAPFLLISIDPKRRVDGDRWANTFAFESIRTVDEAKQVYLGLGYGGPIDR